MLVSLIRRLQFLGLSIRARLALIQFLLLFALLTVSLVAWHVCENERRGGSLLATLSRAERYNLEAGELHYALRADFEALLAGDRSDTAAEVEALASAKAHLRELDVSIARLRDSGLPRDVAARLGAVLERASQNALMARGIVETAPQDRDQASSRITAYLASSGELTRLEDEVTVLLKNQVTAAERATLSDASRSEIWVVLTAALTALVAWGFVALIARSVRNSLRQVSETARALATGNFSARSQISTGDEVGELAVSLNKMANDLQTMVDRLLSEASRDAFGVQLTRALEMAESENQVRDIVSRALGQIDSKVPAELLLTDASQSNLFRVSEHPTAGAAGCSVDTLAGCAAIRRGGPILFETSEALDACPRLRGRNGGAISATCVPISFMGRSFGVLHAAGADRKPLPSPQQAQLAALGLHAGARIGTLRMLENTRMHAYTDGLTGLSNRRALEQFIETLLRGATSYALAMADLDHFKRLNDLQGHETGDRALRTFAEVLKKSVRQTDYVARWGGEEFAIVFPSATAQQAYEKVQQIRDCLAESLRISHHMPFTASFGIADSTMATGFEDVLRIADEALYQSKDNGRDRATIASGAASDAQVTDTLLGAPGEPQQRRAG
jgi:diguanylate cyclase (GGDEF)-like protein